MASRQISAGLRALALLQPPEAPDLAEKLAELLVADGGLRLAQVGARALRECV